MGGSTFEFFEVAGPSATQAALQAFSIEQEAGRITLTDTAIWTTSTMIVIQLNAQDDRRLTDVMSTIIGPPAIMLAGERPLPLPEPSPESLNVEQFESALTAAGLAITRDDSVVRLPWIPATGLVFSVDRATVEVFQTAGVAEAQNALASLFADGSDVAAPANITGWRNGATIVLLRAAPDHDVVAAAITVLMGSPTFATLGGGLPPLQIPPQSDPPSALPATEPAGQGDRRGPREPRGQDDALGHGNRRSRHGTPAPLATARSHLDGGTELLRLGEHPAGARQGVARCRGDRLLAAPRHGT